MVKIPFTKITPGAPFIGYVVENRKKINGDENLPAEGVLISQVNESPDALVKCIVLPDPGQPGTLKDAPLDVGGSYHDPTYNITISVVNKIGDDYKVRIQYKLSPNAKPDPMLIPWGAPPYESADIWIDSEKNGWGTYKYTGQDGSPVGNGDDAWVDRDNRVYVRVRNIGPGAATNVKVQLYVTQPPGIGTKDADWKKLGMIIFPSIIPGQVVEDYVKWKPSVGAHTCIKALIENIPGELSTENNVAQENVSHFTTTAGSPYKPVGLKMKVANPFENEATPVYYHVDDIPPGWTVSIKPNDSILPPGGHEFVDFMAYPPEQDRPGLVGKPKITALVPYGDTYIPIGGVEAWVHLTKPTALDLKLTSGDKAQVGQRVTLEGHITPLLVNAKIAVEFTMGEQREVRFIDTDAAGKFKVVFVPPTAGGWKAQAFYSGDTIQAPAESNLCKFEATGQVPISPAFNTNIKPAPDIKVFINGIQIAWADEVAWLDHNAGRLLVPVRIVAEHLGCRVDWNDADRKVTMERGDVRVKLRIGKRQSQVIDRTVEMDTEPFVTEQNRTLLPLRFVTEALGCRVEWNSDKWEAYITEPERESRRESRTGTGTESRTGTGTESRR